MPASNTSRFEAAQPLYDRRIKRMAWKNLKLLPSVETVDIESELLEVLWLSCMAYDPDHGATFSTFFETNARRRLIDLHKAASCQKRVGDYERVWLDSESVVMAISEMHLGDSAEDEALAIIHVQEVYRSGRRE